MASSCGRSSQTANFRVKRKYLNYDVLVKKTSHIDHQASPILRVEILCSPISKKYHLLDPSSLSHHGNEDPKIEEQTEKSECLQTSVENIEDLVKRAEKNILEDLLPERIHQGSSGSYFVKDKILGTIAVFKPKDEEPYGHLNPKWLKWMHKTCLPCCFGRSCILPNQGYLSEVGASIVDNFFGFNIVPLTTLAWLSSSSFNYSRIDHANLKTKRMLLKKKPNNIVKKIKLQLPPKIGSFQKFVHDYEPAGNKLSIFTSEFLETPLGIKFLEEFHKLVILDYLIRNTDRGYDNWLIKLIDLRTDDVENNWVEVSYSDVKIAAIDNGLAFPFKHPDKWRSYPYSWSSLSFSNIPFSDSIINSVLPLLSNIKEVDNLIFRLKLLFKINSGFDEERFLGQSSVIRGQIFNICHALRNKQSPFELSKLIPVYVKQQSNGIYEDPDEHKQIPLFSCF